MKPSFNFDNLHPTIKANVLNVLKKFNIGIEKVGLCGDKGKFHFSESAATEIMLSAGISLKYCNYALNGVPPNGCDTEFGEIWNWSRCYDGALIQYAIEFANKYFTNTGSYEVGMKYPQFRVDLLIKKFKLELIGTFETEYSKENRLGDYKLFYEVWQDKDKEYTFSFEAGRMGKGGYAGLVVKNVKNAVGFCKWYLSKKSFYVKDLDLFQNGLGGFGIKELQFLNIL